MRDIRADLRERLETAEAEATKLDDLANAAAARVEAIKDMLAAEEARFAGPHVAASAGHAAGVAYLNGTTKTLAPLEDYLVKAVRRGIHDKDELRDAAIREGYFEGQDKSPGRVVHAKLTNLVKDQTLAYEDINKGDRFVLGGN